MRLEPPAQLHVFRGKALAPAPLSPLGKIYERTFLELQTAKLREHSLSRGRNEAASNPCGISGGGRRRGNPRGSD